MSHFTLASALSTVLYLSLTVWGQQETPPPPPTVTLTEKNFDQTISVKKGDIVEVRLPTQLPLDWVKVDGDEILEEPKGFPKTGERKGANPKGLGRTMVRIHRYEVKTDPTSPFRLELMFCKFGKPELTRQRIKGGLIKEPDPPFKRDIAAQDIREGMIYQVTIKPKSP